MKKAKIVLVGLAALALVLLLVHLGANTPWLALIKSLHSRL